MTLQEAIEIFDQDTRIKTLVKYNFTSPAKVEQAINTAEKIVLDALRKTITQRDELAKHSDDPCQWCTHYIKCPEEKCPDYFKGSEGTIDGKPVQWSWTCLDFDYGNCPVRETWCKGCIENNNCNFKWGDK